MTNRLHDLCTHGTLGCNTLSIVWLIERYKQSKYKSDKCNSVILSEAKDLYDTTTVSTKVTNSSVKSLRNDTTTVSAKVTNSSVKRILKEHKSLPASSVPTLR